MKREELTFFLYVTFFLHPLRCILLVSCVLISKKLSSVAVFDSFYNFSAICFQPWISFLRRSSGIPVWLWLKVSSIPRHCKNKCSSMAECCGLLTSLIELIFKVFCLVDITKADPTNDLSTLSNCKTYVSVAYT